MKMTGVDGLTAEKNFMAHGKSSQFGVPIFAIDL